MSIAFNQETKGMAYHSLQNLKLTSVLDVAPPVEDAGLAMLKTCSEGIDAKEVNVYYPNQVTVKVRELLPGKRTDLF